MRIHTYIVSVCIALTLVIGFSGISATHAETMLGMQAQLQSMQQTLLNLQNILRNSGNSGSLGSSGQRSSQSSWWTLLPDHWTIYFPGSVNYGATTVQVVQNGSASQTVTLPPIGLAGSINSPSMPATDINLGFSAPEGFSWSFTPTGNNKICIGSSCPDGNTVAASIIVDSSVKPGNYTVTITGTPEGGNNGMYTLTDPGTTQITAVVVVSDQTTPTPKPLTQSYSITANPSTLSFGGVSSRKPSQTQSTVLSIVRNGYTGLVNVYADTSTIPSGASVSIYTTGNDTYQANITVNNSSAQFSDSSISFIAAAVTGGDYANVSVNLVRNNVSDKTFYITQPDSALLQVGGERVQLRATYKTSYGFANITSYATWSSSDTSVVTVSSSGTVTPIGKGTATITASFAGESDSITVSVNGVSPYPLTITYPTSGATLTKGNSTTIQWTPISTHGTVSIDLVNNTDNSSRNIVSGTSNTGSYVWNYDSLSNGSYALLIYPGPEVRGSNESLPSTHAFSGVFQIVGGTPTPTQAVPSITDVQGLLMSDLQVSPGQRFQITGNNFGSSLTTTNVYIGDNLEKATITQVSDGLIWAVAPSDLKAGSSYSLYVQNSGGSSNEVSVTVPSSSPTPTQAVPSITDVQSLLMSDLQVSPGQRFYITGNNFGSSLTTTNVYIGDNLEKVQITQISGTLIWAVAPLDLKAGSSYSLYVQNSGGSSNEVSVTVPSSTPTPTPTPTPTGTLILSTNVTSASSIQISGFNYSGASLYRIYRNTSSVPIGYPIGSAYPEWVIVTQVPSDLSSFTDTGLSSHTTYYYYVVAVTSSGTVLATSPVVSATTPSVVIVTPTPTPTPTTGTVPAPSITAGVFGSSNIVPRGSSVTIMWTSQNITSSSAQVGISLAGSPPIAIMQPANGTYTWNVPARISTGTYTIVVSISGAGMSTINTSFPITIVSATAQATPTFNEQMATILNTIEALLGSIHF